MSAPADLIARLRAGDLDRQLLDDAADALADADEVRLLYEADHRRANHAERERDEATRISNDLIRGYEADLAAARQDAERIEAEIDAMDRRRADEWERAEDAVRDADRLREALEAWPQDGSVHEINCLSDDGESPCDCFTEIARAALAGIAPTADQRE